MKYLQKKHRIGNTETSFPGKERSGVIRSPPSGVLRVQSSTTTETLTTLSISTNIRRWRGLGWRECATFYFDVYFNVRLHPSSTLIRADKSAWKNGDFLTMPTPMAESFTDQLLHSEKLGGVRWSYFYCNFLCLTLRLVFFTSQYFHLNHFPIVTLSKEPSPSSWTGISLGAATLPPAVITNSNWSHQSE